MKAQLIFLELFTFLHDIFWRVKICLDINFHEERIFGTLVKVNRLLILIESCSAIVQRVIICLDINFHEERILGTLVKVNQLRILIESCSVGHNLLEY
ncbi:hypothetical protein RIR_jg26880.t1 [Rhizophagus irregularis DAOM 181602=DAOM 197198]|nr:hypothetical protein RIR_jg26880.t1 [Rhizophagus irregularis DAOM 181602=DAOM 197198]